MTTLLTKVKANLILEHDADDELLQRLIDAAVARHDISEEQQMQNSEVILQLEKRSRVAMDFYRAFHDIHEEGVITEISLAYRYLKLNNEKIYFDDIYRIEVTEIELGTNRKKEQAAFF